MELQHEQEFLKEMDDEWFDQSADERESDYHNDEYIQEYIKWADNKLKNLGKGEAGTGYALLSDGWRDGKTEKPNDREEIIVCIDTDDYIIGMYRNETESVVERHTDDKYNINYYKWKRITAPSF